jgi:sugar phosphate isomerase/epimerase
MEAIMPFQIACQTLPYSELSLERAIAGIAGAGYKHAALGTTHQGKPALDPAAGVAAAVAVKRQFEKGGLDLVMMFAMTNGLEPGGPEKFRKRIDQAKAAGVPFLLSMGTGGYAKWPDQKHTPEKLAELSARFVEAIRPIGDHAAKAGVMIVLKPHTGNTETGVACLKLMKEIACPAIQVCYDAGNVRFYEGVDPHEDVKVIRDYVRALCIKDHRGPRANPVFPCPGDGDVDHRRLLKPLCGLPWSIPLAVERFEDGRVKKEMSAELIDSLAKRARLHLESVVAGL